MKETNEIADVEQQVETLETEVKKHADGLPYWAKYLAEKILSGNTISDVDLEISYSYLREELKLKEETEKPEIVINYNTANEGNYKPDLLLTKLENVEGVISLDETRHILYKRGSVNYYKTYPGLYIRSPLEVRIIESDVSPKIVCEEILALSKTNWNNTHFDGKFPITIGCARKVAN